MQILDEEEKLAKTQRDAITRDIKGTPDYFKFFLVKIYRSICNFLQLQILQIAFLYGFNQPEILLNSP